MELNRIKSIGALRVGAVPYLNAVPLWMRLGQDVVREVPSKLAQMLRSGELDVALVPIVECLRGGEDYVVVDGVGIGCDGAVESVLVELCQPLSQVRTVAVDAASITSERLARILLPHQIQHEIQWVEESTIDADARLHIGDRAREVRASRARVIDLGLAWKELTGEPFIFAVWAMRRSCASRAVAENIRTAARSGCLLRAHCARNVADLTYLTRALRYTLGEREKKGICLFSHMLVKAGLERNLGALRFL